MGSLAVSTPDSPAVEPRSNPGSGKFCDLYATMGSNTQDK